MSLIKTVFGAVKWEMAIGVVTGLVSGLLHTALIVLITKAVGQMYSGHTLHLVGTFFVCLIALIAAELASKVWLTKLSLKVVLNLQKTLARSVLNVPYQQFEQMGKPKYFATFTQDVGNVSQAFSMLPHTLISSVIILCVVGYLLKLSVAVCLLVLLVMVPMFVAYIWLDRKVLSKCFIHSRAAWDNWFKALKSLLDGKKELALNQQLQQQFRDQDLEAAADNYFAANYKAMRLFTMVQSCWGLAYYLVIFLIVLGIGANVFHDPKATAHAVMLVIFMLGPIVSLSNVLPSIRKAVISLGKIVHLGLTDQQLQANAQDQDAFESIVLKSIITTMPSSVGKDFSVGPIDLTLKSSSVNFVVGSNGSGKSTLIKTLVGLYQSDSGEIYLNDEPIQAEQLQAYRACFDVIFYDFFLFDNVLNYNTAINREAFNQALVELEIDQAVKIQDGTILTHALSDGQRKRLALAVARMSDRPVIVFDEWACDQDPRFKDHFYRYIIPSLKAQGKCVVVVSHDANYFDVADNVLDLDAMKLSKEA